jgi:hypothetical protein
MFPPAFILTIYNTKTREARCFVTPHYETADEYELFLQDNEVMFINEHPTPAPEADNDKD